MSTTTGGTTFGSISNAPGRIEKHRLNKTIRTSATVQATNATVTVSTAAIQTVRKADRVPSSNTGLKTGRVTRTQY